MCSNSYVQRSPLVLGGADKPGLGTGTWISENQNDPDLSRQQLRHRIQAAFGSTCC